MCGLGAVIYFDQRFSIEAKTLDAMIRRIEHRGPDATGVWESLWDGPYFAVGLVHCRLSVLDPDARANQPMSDSTGRFTIVYNGEIYNYRELRQELQRLEPELVFRTESDSEVILAAYQAWGEQCVRRLNGMFAFVVIDSANRSIFAARDRMGQKPLYLAAIDADGNFLDLLDQSSVHRPIAGIAFASEIAAIRTLNWSKWPMREEVLQQYLLWGYIPSPATIYQGIYSLPPASAMTVALRQARTWRYFNPNATRPVYQPGESDVEATRRLVIEATRRQLVSDVPIGCFLSGGIDSSIIAAAMKAATPAGQKVMTFSVGFEDARYDETPYARAVAEHLGTQHHEFHLRLNAAEDLPKVCAAFSQPFADSSALPTYHLSRVARQHVKVALSGDGGDELFGGYDRYRAMHLATRTCPATRWLLSRGIWQGLPGTHPKGRISRFKRFARSLNLPPALRYARYMQLFSPEQILLLQGKAPGSAAVDESYLTEAFCRLSDGRDDLQTALALDRISYLPEDLLTKVDRASMQFALEVRSPFMDPEVVYFASTLDAAQLLSRGGKTLLRQAFAPELPRGHFARRKMGFAVPIGEWFRGELRSMLIDSLSASNSFATARFAPRYVQRLIDEHMAERVDHSQRLYALLALELWHRG